MQRIKKAVVAVAGSGTRFLPATKSMPKEMLPIIDKPIIQLLVEELVAGGIEDVILVTKWDKKPLEDFFDHSWALEQELKNSGKEKELKEILRISEMANFIYIRQKGSYGNGTPVLSAESLVKDEPFIYCYGDDLVKSNVSFTKQMVEEFERTGHLMMGVQKVPEEEVCKYGIVQLKPNSMQLEDIIEKPEDSKAPSRFASFGRFVLSQDIIEKLKETKLGKGNELWLADAIRKYMKAGGEFYAKEVEGGEWLTTGDPLNYLKAMMKYAMDREDIGQELNNYFQSNICKL
jgi:UTP--glucose-1-phosphate uridylyltransferase